MNHRIKELDGVRGVAILMVILWHYVACLITEEDKGSFLYYLSRPTVLFWSGVDLFFVLSGFLIGGIILDHHQKQNFIKVYWLRRCCRILPVYILLLSICLALKITTDPARFHWLFNNLMPWWSYATFTQNIMMGLNGSHGGHFLGITWSLAVEEQFYLFAPFAMICLGQKWWVRSLIPLIISALVLRCFFPGFHSSINTLFRMDSLLSGVLISVLIRTPVTWSRILRTRGIFLATCIIMLAATIMLIRSNALGEFIYTWLALLYSIFLIVVLTYQGTSLTSVLRANSLTFWGRIAYGLYMYHQAVLGLLHGCFRGGQKPGLSDDSAILLTVISFVVSSILSWLSFRSFESYFLEWGKKFSYNDNGDLAEKKLIIS